MELTDVIGDAWPCWECGEVRGNHAFNYEAVKDKCPNRETSFIPEKVENVFNLKGFENTPLADIASRLKAL